MRPLTEEVRGTRAEGRHAASVASTACTACWPLPVGVGEAGWKGRGRGHAGRQANRAAGGSPLPRPRSPLFRAWSDGSAPARARTRALPPLTRTRAHREHKKPTTLSTPVSTTPQETKAVFEKLHKYMGKAIRALVERPDEEHVLRLHRNRVYYVLADLMRKATNVSGWRRGERERAEAAWRENIAVP